MPNIVDIIVEAFRLILRLCFALLCVVLAACAAVSQDRTDNTLLPVVQLAANQNDCDRSASIEILYPKRFEGSTHSATLFQAVENDQIKFVAYLVRIDSMQGSFLCIDDQLQKISRVYITYGSTHCFSYKYKFEFSDFSSLVQGESKPLVLTAIIEDEISKESCNK